MSNKITIVRVIGRNDKLTVEDIERWRHRFAIGDVSVEEAEATGEVVIQTLPEKNEEDHYITLVRVGGDDYVPTVEDLDMWRKVFEEAAKDPDFKIFTHPAVEVDVINIGKIIAVE